MKKIFDTNIMLDSPEIIFEHDDVIFPVTILQELDNHKFKPDTGYSARAAIRAIRKFINDPTKTYSFDQMVDTSATNDRNIIDSASRNKATLYTKDIAMSFIAKTYNVDVVLGQDNDNMDFSPYIVDNYSKYPYPEDHEHIIMDQELEEFKAYIKEKHDRELKPWDFIIQNNDNVWCYNPYQNIVENIKNVKETTKFYVDGNKFKPKDIYQKMAVYAILNAPAAFVTGKQGCGKSLIGLATALYLNAPKKVYIIRPSLKRKAYETGFLPGDKNEKMEEYISGFISAMYYIYGNTATNNNPGDQEKDVGIDYVKDHILPAKCEIITMNMLHGLSLQRDDIIVCDEAQFLDTTSLQLLMTRIGEGAKLILLGDVEQHYDLIRKSESGITALMKHLPDQALAFVKLEESYRNKELTDLALKLTE